MSGSDFALKARGDRRAAASDAMLRVHERLGPKHAAGARPGGYAAAPNSRPIPAAAAWPAGAPKLARGSLRRVSPLNGVGPFEASEVVHERVSLVFP